MIEYGRHREKSSGTACDLLGRSLRILTHQSAEMCGIGEKYYHDAVVIREFPKYSFLGKVRSNPVFLVDFGKWIPQREETRYPIRFVALRSIFNVYVSSVIEGYWVEIDPFIVNPEMIDRLKGELIDLDDEGFFHRMKPQMCYLTPPGDDPYVERWKPHRLITFAPTEPQPYGKKHPRAFDMVVETIDGKTLRGWTRQDIIAEIKSGENVNLNYDLVNCSIIERMESSKEAIFRKYEAGGIYDYEVIGIVQALWWPEVGVFDGGDLAGTTFTLQVGDLFVTLEDILDKRKEIGGITMGDNIHAVGQLEFSLRHEDRIRMLYSPQEDYS